MPQNPFQTYAPQPGGSGAVYNVNPQSVGLSLLKGGVAVPRSVIRVLPVAVGSSGSLTLYDSASTGVTVAVAGMTNGSAAITGVNGFSAGQPVYLTGTVPLPYLVLTQYFVSATGLSNAGFQLATTVGGTPALVTGSTGNVGVSPGIVTTFTNASASLAATAHGLIAGQQVTLIGTVPLPYYTNTTYYVSATGLTANAYELALTPTATPAAVTGSTTTVDVATGNHLGNQIITVLYSATTVGLPLALEVPLANGLVVGACPVAAQYTITLG